MIFFHHDSCIELADPWWVEAGMPGFKAAEPAYRVDVSQAHGLHIILVPISDIEPVRRVLSHGVFNNNEEMSAQHRVVRILKGFRKEEPLPPVEVVRNPPGSARPYKLTAGVHRLYCSLAAGFTHVPTIEGYDPDDGVERLQF
jgi:hypothetical protein